MIIKERRGNRLKKPPNPLSPNSRKPYHQRPSSDRRLIDAGGVTFLSHLGFSLPSQHLFVTRLICTKLWAVGFSRVTARPKEDGGGEGRILEPRVWLDLTSPILDLQLSPPDHGCGFGETSPWPGSSFPCDREMVGGVVQRVRERRFVSLVLEDDGKGFDVGVVNRRRACCGDSTAKTYIPAPVMVVWLRRW